MRTEYNLTKEQTEKVLRNEKVYLSDIIDEFPKNCIFSKGYTGSGGTTLALRDDKPTIVAMPFIPAVKDKLRDTFIDKQMFGVYGENKDYKALSRYLTSGSISKICCTWDSLSPLINMMRYLNIDLTSFRLVVDEWHEMFNSYRFRNKAVRGVLDNAFRFGDVVYMSATPIAKKWHFKEMQGLDECVINYSHRKYVELRETGQVRAEVIKTVKSHINGSSFGNAHLFVNSVSFIADIINTLGLDETKVKVVCSENLKNKSKLGKLKISSTSDEVKKINFYTSRAFIGCDIFDKDGVPYIVSDGKGAVTSYDVSTNYQQILGRIRDSKSDKAVHIFKKTRYNNLSTEEFKSFVEKNKKEGLTLVKTVNSLSLNERRLLIESMRDNLNEKYISIDDFEYTLSIDENLYNGDIAKYEMVHGDYASVGSICKALKQEGHNIDVKEGSLTDDFAKNKSKRTTFKERFEEYSSIRDNASFSLCKDERLELMEEIDDLLKPAYETIGTAGIEKIGYVKRDIRWEIKKLSKMNISTKIISMLEYSNGEVVLTSKKNKDLAKIVEVLGLNFKPKLNDYYETKPTTKRVKGQLKSAIQIIYKKTVIKNEG